MGCEDIKVTRKGERERESRGGQMWGRKGEKEVKLGRKRTGKGWTEEREDMVRGK